MAIKIIIPTHGRSDIITTHTVVENAIICVSKSQHKKYVEALGKDYEYLVHPDTVKGLSPKRQWIYDKVGDVFMLDDDITELMKVYEEGKKMKCASPQFAYELIQTSAEIARDMGAYFFGFSNYPNPVMFRAVRPIELTGFINGCAFGLLKGSRLKFNPEVVAVEDYYISAMNAYHHRYCYIDRRFHFAQKNTFSLEGGQSYFRTEKTEERDIKLLNRYFGSAIVSKTDTKKARNKNKFGRTLKIPF